MKTLRAKMNFEEFRKLQTITEINKLKVSYVAIGEGPSVLLIHGIPVWGYLWKDTIELLSKHFTLIIPDLVGYGYSDKRDCFDRSIKVQSDILTKLVDQLGIEELFVVGHDIGGAVAQRFTIDNQTRVQKLVLMDSVLYDSWPADPIVSLGNPKQHYRNKGDELAKKFIQRLPAGIFHKEIATPEMLEGWMKPYSTEEGKLSLIRNASALNTNHTMELMEELKQLKKPKLLIWGEKDQFQPISTAEKFHQEVVNTELIKIPDSDHFLPLEKPKETAELLIQFFS